MVLNKKYYFKLLVVFAVIGYCGCTLYSYFLDHINYIVRREDSSSIHKTSDNDLKAKSVEVGRDASSSLYRSSDNDLKAETVQNQNQDLKREYLTWKKVFLQSQSSYLYVLSAFYDDIADSPLVRIIAYGKMPDDPRSVHCIYNDQDSVKQESCFALVKNKFGIVSMLNCKASSSQAPEFIYLQYGTRKPIKLMVTDAGKRSCYPEKKKISIDVNVRPLHNNYDNVNQLLEFVEYYRIQGVSHFTFYKGSCSDQVAKLLHYYENLGILTIVSEGSKKKFNKSPLHVITITDGIFRSRARFSHMIAIDMDEFVLPRSHKDLPSLIKILKTQHISGYKAKRYEFFKYFAVNANAQRRVRSVIGNETKIKSDTQVYTTRIAHACKGRGKTIVRPCMAVRMHAHDIVESVKGFRPIQISSNKANVHHYREFHKGDRVFRKRCPKTRQSVSDTRMHKFMNILPTQMLYTLSKSEVVLNKT